MSKKEAKGQRVKSFKCFVPQPDLSKEETQIVVYLKADTGRFHIYQGEHMLDACKEQAQKSHSTHALRFGENYISCADLNQLVDGFNSLCGLYERLLRDMKKTRVIRFRFKRNLPAGLYAKNDDISFCGSPAVHFDYELLWRVDDKLFSGGEDGFGLQYRGGVKDRHDEGAVSVVDWTQEREDFFENMRNALITLIGKVEDFQSNLRENVDRAIAGYTTPLLAAPVTSQQHSAQGE